MDRLDRKDVTDTAFDVVLRGYDKRQVDDRLRFLGAELIAAQEALRAATHRVTMLEDALSEAQSAAGGEPLGEVNFGARVEKILTLAEDEAREVRSQAEAAAVALVDQARTQVAELRQSAEQEISSKRAEADQLVAQARAEADRMIAAATDAAQQRERSSAHELHQLSRLQEEINADLCRVKDLLDSLFGASGAVPGMIGHRIRTGAALPAYHARTV